MGDSIWPKSMPSDYIMKLWQDNVSLIRGSNLKPFTVWMALPTQWTWVLVDSRSWWWTGRPGMLWFIRLQRVRHDWVTELNWTESQQVRPWPKKKVSTEGMPCEEDRMLKSRILFSAFHSKHLVELLEFKAAKDKNMRVTSSLSPPPCLGSPGVFLSQHSTWASSSSSCLAPQRLLLVGFCPVICESLYLFVCLSVCSQGAAVCPVILLLWRI